MSVFRRWLRRLPYYPVLRASWHVIRSKSIGERIDHRDRRLTTRILHRVLTPDANCVDVGANRGEVLAELLRLAPRGRHVAVEPIPALAEALRAEFPGVEVANAALADQTGEATFHVVETNPALSGLRLRPDVGPGERVVPITVPVARLDDLVPSDRRVSLLKVDVEGGELGVLRGAARVLGRDRPWVLFEHGQGAPSVYGTTSEAVFAELAGQGLAVWRLDHWLDGRSPLALPEFLAAIATGEYWNWLAGPEPGLP